MGLFDIFNPSKGVAPGPKLTPAGQRYAKSKGMGVRGGQVYDMRDVRAPKGNRPTGKGIGARSVSNSWNLAQGSMAPKYAQNDLDRTYLGNQNAVDNAGYDIQKRKWDSDYNAATRQPGYINSLYNNTLANNDQQRFQQGIQNQANQRQYGMITADRGDIAANRKDNAADWAAYQETNADKGTEITQNEKMARIVAAEQVAGRGMMGVGARAGVIQGRDQKGRDLAQNVRDLAAGNRQFDSRNRQFDAQGRDLDERWATTKDNEGLGNSRMAQLGLERDRYGIQNREDIASAYDNITNADVARQYGANRQTAGNLKNQYDLWSNGADRNQLNVDTFNTAFNNLPYFTQQEQQKVRTAQGKWDTQQAKYDRYQASRPKSPVVRNLNKTGILSNDTSWTGMPRRIWNSVFG
jgi:hypothetical protein